MNMHLKNYPPTAVYFPTQTAKQYKPLSLSVVSNLQFGKYVTHIDSNGTWVPAIITRVMVFIIYGDPMYLVKVTHNQNHQSNIDSLHEPSDPEIFFIKSNIWPLHTNMSPKKPVKTIGFGPHWHTPATTTVYPTSPVDQRLQQHFQPAITGYQVMAENTTADTPLLK